MYRASPGKWRPKPAARGSQSASAASGANAWRRSRSARISHGWNEVHPECARSPNDPAFQSQSRDPALLSIVCGEWMQSEERCNSWAVAHIQPETASGVSDLQTFESQDPKYTVGNIIQRSHNQYDLYLRGGSCSLAMEDIEAHCDGHPCVKSSTLKWNSNKLKKSKLTDHESSWNIQFHTWDGHKVTCGLTRHLHGKDETGAQITHAWFMFSELMSSSNRAHLCDLLLNVCGYYSWFGLGVARRTGGEPQPAAREEPPPQPVPQTLSQEEPQPVPQPVAREEPPSQLMPPHEPPKAPSLGSSLQPVAQTYGEEAATYGQAPPLLAPVTSDDAHSIGEVCPSPSLSTSSTCVATSAHVFPLIGTWPPPEGQQLQPVAQPCPPLEGQLPQPVAPPGPPAQEDTTVFGEFNPGPHQVYQWPTPSCGTPLSEMMDVPWLQLPTPDNLELPCLGMESGYVQAWPLLGAQCHTEMVGRIFS